LPLLKFQPSYSKYLEDGYGTFFRMLVITYHSARCHNSAEHSIVFQYRENFKKRSERNRYLVMEIKGDMFGNGNTNRPVW